MDPYALVNSGTFAQVSSNQKADHEPRFCSFFTSWLEFEVPLRYYLTREL